MARPVDGVDRNGDAPVPLTTGRRSILPADGRHRAAVVAVLAVAAALRVALALGQAYTPNTDAADFDRIAASLAGGQGYGPTGLPGAQGPSAFRAPLYPFVLALTYRVAGNHNWTAGLVVNALLGVAVVALLGLVAAQLFGRRVALIAMGLAAIHPAMIVVGSGLQLEALLVTLTVGALAAALQHRRDPRGLLWPLLAGVLVGLAILTRELGFLLIPPIGWLLVTAPPGEGRRPRAALAAPLAMAALAVALAVPWTVRNAVVMHAFVPVTTSAGVGLAGTYNETARGATAHPAEWIPPFQDPGVQRILAGLQEPTEVNIDAALRGESIDMVRAHPAYVGRVVFWNAVRLLDLDGGDFSVRAARFLPYPTTLTRVAIDASYAVAALGALGALQRRARRIPPAVWAVPGLVAAFMLLFLPAYIRYRASLEPFLVLLAALAIDAAVTWRSEARARR